MAAYLVRRGSADAREEKKAIGHCVASRDQSSCRGLAKKIAAAKTAQSRQTHPNARVPVLLSASRRQPHPPDPVWN